jgi:hypothetical protein
VQLEDAEIQLQVALEVVGPVAHGVLVGEWQFVDSQPQ